MIDRESGRAEFAIMEFGGLFGIGSDHYPIPWSMLEFEANGKGIVVDLKREQLEKAPRHGDMPPAYDRDYSDMVRSYYTLQPSPFI